MDDPLSVAVLIAGVVSLGDQVCGDVQSYLDSLESQTTTSRQRACELRDLIDRIRVRIHTGRTAIGGMEQSVRSTVASCEDAIKTLNDDVARLEKGKGTEYSFRHEDLPALELRLCDAKSSLQTLFEVLQWDDKSCPPETNQNFATSIAVSPSPQSQLQSRVDHHIQNINNGEGSQFNANTFNGPVHFTITHVSGLHIDDTAGPSSNISIHHRNQARSGRYQAQSLGKITKTSAYLSRPLCSCMTRRYWTRVSKSWGVWSISLQKRLIKYHAPSCRFAKSPDQMTKFSLGFHGLRYLLRGSLGFHLAMASDAGSSFRISPTMSYFPVVDKKTAPAFRTLELATDAIFASFKGDLTYRATEILDIVEYCVATLDYLYSRPGSLQRVSPRDVDSEGRTVMHDLIGFLYYANVFYHALDQDPAPAVELAQRAVQLLIAHGVPAMRHAHNGESPMTVLVGNTPGIVGVEMAKMLHLQDPESPILLTHNYRPHPWRRNFLWSFNRAYHMPGIVEASGFGPLGLAIAAGDTQKIVSLIESDPSCLLEVNSFGQQPLHLSVGSPELMKILLSFSQKPAMEATDIHGSTPLDYAVKLHATPSVEVLLEAGCVVRCPILDEIYDEGSTRLVVRAIAERRNWLKDLGLQHLPKIEAREMGLYQPRVLDSSALRVQRRLESFGIQIPTELSVESSAAGVYHRRLPVSVLNSLWDQGFEDVDTIDAEGSSPLFKHLGYPHAVEWLIQHGADITTPPSERSVLQVKRHVHDLAPACLIMANIGSEWQRYVASAETYPGIETENVLSSAIQTVQSCLPIFHEDICTCICSEGGCTPFSVLLKWLCWKRYRFYSAADLSRLTMKKPNMISKSIVCFTTKLKHSLTDFHYRLAVRVLTFQALEVRHTCCFFRRPDEYSSHGLSIEDAQDINSEQPDLLQEFQDLVDELTGVFFDDYGAGPLGVADPDSFWNKKWLPRVTEVRAKFNGDELTADEKVRMESVGMVFHKRQAKNQRSVAPRRPRLSALDQYRAEIAEILGDE